MSIVGENNRSLNSTNQMTKRRAHTGLTWHLLSIISFLSGLIVYFIASEVSDNMSLSNVDGSREVSFFWMKVVIALMAVSVASGIVGMFRIKGVWKKVLSSVLVVVSLCLGVLALLAHAFSYPI